MPEIFNSKMHCRGLLELSGVTKRYRDRRRKVTAVENVYLNVDYGESLGLVGESGCGKSTLARIAAALDRPEEGSVLFEGKDLCSLKGEDRRLTRRGLQIVFQDCGSALNPRITVGETVAEPLINFKLADGIKLKERVKHLFNIVGLDEALIVRYPHQLSGGQRQRVGIARALACKPRLVICDEPVSSLDVSVQAQIINLMLDLKDSFNLSYLFISHDLAVVYQVCDRVAVMYLGRIAEILPVERLAGKSLHPYTRSLVAAVPSDNPLRRGYSKLTLFGEATCPGDRRGCLFAPRCGLARPLCFEKAPVPVDLGGGHMVACHNSPGDFSGPEGRHGCRAQDGLQPECLDDA